MKEIIVVRHAKSDWANEALKDIDRYLSENGYCDAYQLSNWFSKNKKLPNKILSSTATRALSTALIFARAMDFPVSRFVLEPKIYEANTKTLLKLINQQNDSDQSLMLFGHNPGLTDLCNKLGKDFYLDNLPTCGMLVLRFDCHKWSEITHKSANVIEHFFPKEFKN